MNKLYYQFPDTWFGDCMPFGYKDKFYLYHQRDTRKPGPFGEPFGWDLATTSDFVDYEDCGVAVPRGTDEEQDQFIFAGSVFEAEGKFHIFYTGYNRDYPAQGKASQVLMHAVSDDLRHWTKTQEALTFCPQEGYDPDDWRDPFVIWNEEAQEYLLILGARKIGPKTEQTGRTVKFTSKDLKNWEFKGDFWAPGLYTMHEMPDLFKIGDWWYHIISEYSDKNKIIYRMSRSLEGPWIAPVDDAFDGRAYYAGRTFCLNGQRTLGVKIPDTVWEAFGDRESLSDVKLESPYARTEKILAEACGDLYSFEADITFSEGTRSFGIRVLENEKTAQSYQYIFPVGENKYVFEKNPNWPWFGCMNIGLERPITLRAGETYHVQMILDDTIVTLYVNGVALNSRIYEKPGDALSVFVTDGTMEIRNISIARGLDQA